MGRRAEAELGDHSQGAGVRQTWVQIAVQRCDLGWVPSFSGSIPHLKKGSVDPSLTGLMWGLNKFIYGKLKIRIQYVVAIFFPNSYYSRTDERLALSTWEGFLLEKCLLIRSVQVEAGWLNARAVVEGISAVQSTCGEPRGFQGSFQKLIHWYSNSLGNSEKG